jgi:hypothetical protein
MAHYDFQVFIRRNLVWVEIENVQGVSFTYGQQRLTETWSPPVYIINGRRPDLVGDVNIGDYVSVTNTGTQTLDYKVTNYQVNYGIKSSMDTWTMQIESLFSQLARSVVTTDTGGNSGIACNKICTAAGFSLTKSGSAALPFNGALTSTTYLTDENGLDAFLTAANTGQSGWFFGQVYLNNGNLRWRQELLFPSNPAYEFTDDPASALDPDHAAVFDEVQFGSLALNYADKVIVTPAGGAAQTVGTGDTAFTTNSYSYTNAYALEMANRYYGLLAASDSVPVSLSFSLEQQSATAVIPNQYVELNNQNFCSITLRGTTYYATILGQDMTSSPDFTRITLYLCASANGNFFTLNSASLGVLDQNRLGF